MLLSHYRGKTLLRLTSLQSRSSRHIVVPFSFRRILAVRAQSRTSFTTSALPIGNHGLSGGMVATIAIGLPLALWAYKVRNAPIIELFELILCSVSNDVHIPAKNNLYGCAG
jgi:hypothetical protein